MPHADLPHLAGRVFGAPLMMARTKLDIVLDVLRPRLFGGDLAGAGPAAEPDPYVVTPSGIAVIPVFGTLVNRSFGLSALSGLTSYQRLSADLARAAADPAVRGLLLDVDSNGGEAGGVFDLADEVAALRGVKPVFAVANEACFSAAYALACGAERLYVTQTGGVGSIGVVALHRDQSGADAQAGFHYEYLSADARKTDGNPHEPLSDSARAALQAEVDRLYGLFAAHVARCRRLTDAQVRGQEAGLTFGPDAVAAGLADRVGTLADLTARVTTSRPSGRSGGASCLPHRKDRPLCPMLPRPRPPLRPPPKRRCATSWPPRSPPKPRHRPPRTRRRWPPGCAPRPQRSSICAGSPDSRRWPPASSARGWPRRRCAGLCLKAAPSAMRRAPSSSPIRLNLPHEPYWLDLPFGVRLHVRPIDTALDAAARFAAVEALRADAAAANTETGPAARARRLGRAKAALATSCAQAAILAWEGVLDADGAEPAPETPETVARLMAVPAIAEAFVTAWYQPLERLAAEGEGCGAAPDGITAAAPTIAGDAEPMATPPATA